MNLAVRTLMILALSAGSSLAAEQELGLTLGALSGPDRNLTGSAASPARLRFSTGTALQANYARRFATLPNADLLFEVHFLASPQQHVAASVSSATSLSNATRDIAALYVTPGLRVKFYPARRMSPWAAVGGGYSLYEQSTATLGGTPNPAPRHSSGGALQFGGGADFKVWKALSLRGEAREFYTASPKFNVSVAGTGQFHLVVGGGIVWRFGR